MNIFIRRPAVISLLVLASLGSVEAQALKRVEQADFGTASDGSLVKLITLRNNKGMSARIITYGAIIKELQAPDRDGKFTNVLLTTDSQEKFERFNGAAAIIGRVVNRIGGAQFELDGTTYRLTVNEKKNSIHEAAHIIRPCSQYGFGIGEHSTTLCRRGRERHSPVCYALSLQ